jgi:hypothetical protein
VYEIITGEGYPTLISSLKEIIAAFIVEVNEKPSPFRHQITCKNKNIVVN